MRVDSDRRSHAPPVILHPRLVELLHRRALRQRIGAAVERLIEALDALDDAEAEPSLGSPNVIFASQSDQRRWAEGATDDREADPADDEPSLGALIAADHDHTGWSRGTTSDREAEAHD